MFVLKKITVCQKTAKDLSFPDFDDLMMDLALLEYIFRGGPMGLSEVLRPDGDLLEGPGALSTNH